MKHNNVIVAFGSSKTSDAIVRMLSSAGIGVSAICSSAMEVKQQLAYLGTGTLICGYKLKDSSVISLFDDVPDEFNIVLIGSLSKLELCEDSRVFKLSVPLKRDDLVYSVMMLMNMNPQRMVTSQRPIRKNSEQEIIMQAKHLLIDKYHMTEEEAHRYIQKKSMDTGTKMIDIARIILN